MKYDDILITGGRGLVGSALRELMGNAMYVDREDYDLTSERDVIRMYNYFEPTRVIHLAAKVGGMYDNTKHPVSYLEENLLMNTLMLRHAYSNGITRYLALSSSCSFPDVVDNYPMKEEDMYKGSPTITNLSYGMAKRIMAIQIEAYNSEYGTQYNYIIPCNIYGKEGVKDPYRGHFIESLIKKIYEAEQDGSNHIVVWGTGNAIRQCMYVDDVAKIIKVIVDNDITESFNVAPERNVSIRDIVDITLQALNMSHFKVEFDDSMPDGQLRKDISTERLKRLIPNFEFTTLEDGIRTTYNKYKLKCQKRL